MQSGLSFGRTHQRAGSSPTENRRRAGKRLVTPANATSHSQYTPAPDFVKPGQCSLMRPLGSGFLEDSLQGVATTVLNTPDAVLGYKRDWHVV